MEEENKQKDKPERYENTEQFSFKDQKGREIAISSAIFPVNELCGIAAEFLGMDFKVANKGTPGYTQ